MWRRESLEEKQGVAGELVREAVRSHFSRCGWVRSRTRAQSCLLFLKKEGWGRQGFGSELWEMVLAFSGAMFPTNNFLIC